MTSPVLWLSHWCSFECVNFHWQSDVSQRVARAWGRGPAGMVENGFWGWLSSLLPLAGLELIQHPGVAESPGASMLPKSRGPPGLTAATGHTMIPGVVFFFFLIVKLCLKTILHIITTMFQVYSLMILYFYFIEWCNDHYKSVLELFCPLSKILHEHLYLILISISCLSK